MLGALPKSWLPMKMNCLICHRLDHSLSRLLLYKSAQMLTRMLMHVQHYLQSLCLDKVGLRIAYCRC